MGHLCAVLLAAVLGESLGSPSLTGGTAQAQFPAGQAGQVVERDSASLSKQRASDMAT